jgi:Ca2+-binding RTX toxin-like protein
MSWWKNFTLGTNGNDTITTGDGRDIIISANGDDIIYSGGGNDLVFAGSGDDTVFAGEGNDRVYGGSGNDTIHGEGGNDWLFGQKGDDTLYGGSGNDKLYGGYHNDIFFGGTGHDLIIGGQGNDEASGGEGDDIVLLGSGHDKGRYDIDANMGSSDYYHGGSGQDTLHLSVTDKKLIELAISEQDIINAFNSAKYGVDFSDLGFNLYAKSFENIDLEVIKTNEAPLAQDDTFNVMEDGVLTASVLADNGNGADSDPNGDPLTITAVNGEAANVGMQISLASGALLTLNADGSFSYDQNGAFNNLAEGAQAMDSFTYTISDGEGEMDSAAVTLNISGVNDAPTATNVLFNADDAVNTNAMALGSLMGQDVDNGDTLTYSFNTVSVNLPAGLLENLGGVADDFVQTSVSDNEVTITFLSTLANDNSGETMVLSLDQTTGQVSVVKNNAPNFLTAEQALMLVIGYSVTDVTGASASATATLNITGLDNNDVLVGTPNNDLLAAGVGNDLVIAGAGSDSHDGGLGNDTIVFNEVFDKTDNYIYDFVSNGVFTVEDTNLVNGDEGTDTLQGFERIRFNDGIGGTRDYQLVLGTDELDGDLINPLTGTDGDDFILAFDNTVMSREEVTAGGLGDDILHAGSSASNNNITLYGETFENAGNINVAGDDILNATSNSARAFLYGEGSRNSGTINTAGNDTLNGNSGDDRLYGDVFLNSGTVNIAGDDILNGGAGDDRLYGDASQNSGIIDTAGNDTLNGGLGNDTLVGDVDSNFGEINIAGDDILNGGAGNDRLFGDIDANQSILGISGNDRLNGGLGDDELWGDDELALFARDGEDTFVYHVRIDDVLVNEGNDIIYDFDNDRDKIEINNGTDFDTDVSVAADINGHALITLSSGTTITLTGVAFTAIDASDFNFV